MSPKESRTDVLIVGAGPVGLSLAIMLAQMKVNIRIIDKRTETGAYSRAFLIQSRTQEIFRQLGVLEAITQKGRTGNLGFRAFYHGEPLYDVSLPLSSSSCPCYVGLEQSETELILSARLKELGIEIEKGIELESFVFKKDEQVAESALVSSIEDKAKEVISFKYVVGCDGGQSLTRNLAGISFSGERINIALTLCDVVVKTNLKTIPFGNLFFNEKKNILMLWLNEDKWRIVIPLVEGESEPTEDEFFDIVKGMVAPQEVHPISIVWLNTFWIKERRAEIHFKDNIFLCGDAAHVHSPAGGQGMNTGIQDAYNLAWKLALMVKEVGDSNALSQTFDEERKMVAQIVLKNSGNMLRNLLLPSTTFSLFLKKRAIPFFLSFPSIRQIAVDSLSEVTFDYPESCLIRKTIPGWISNGLVAGVGLRMPQFELVQTHAPCEVTSTHQLFKGGHCFELVLYVPGMFLAEGNVENLRCTIALLQSSPTLLCHRDGLKHRDAIQPLFSISLIINTKVFQPDQWCHALSNSDVASETRGYFKSYPTFLDQASAISSHYKFPHDSVSLLIIRPDLHVGAIMHPSPETIQKEIEGYFNRFLDSDY